METLSLAKEEENVILSVIYNPSTLELVAYLVRKKRRVLTWAKDGQINVLNDSIPCVIK